LFRPVFRSTTNFQVQKQVIAKKRARALALALIVNVIVIVIVIVIDETPGEVEPVTIRYISICGPAEANPEHRALYCTSEGALDGSEDASGIG
jgi:hypothetical protein